MLGHLWFINRLLECYLSFPLLWWIMQKTGQASPGSVLHTLPVRRRVLGDIF
ncbi:hypothetical protein BMR05_01640 [Methylococcaceae bacterium HT4]|nr:hypothetical protein BMR05_01640 [Methylococcaceae bacterium HT4]